MPMIQSAIEYYSGIPRESMHNTISPKSTEKCCLFSTLYSQWDNQVRQFSVSATKRVNPATSFHVNLTDVEINLIDSSVYYDQPSITMCNRVEDGGSIYD